eukprot:749597-Hanusia_phi.AAC.1
MAPQQRLARRPASRAAARSDRGLASWWQSRELQLVMQLELAQMCQAAPRPRRLTCMGCRHRGVM